MLWAVGVGLKGALESEALHCVCLLLGMPTSPCYPRTVTSKLRAQPLPATMPGKSVYQHAFAALPAVSYVPR